MVDFTSSKILHFCHASLFVLFAGLSASAQVAPAIPSSAACIGGAPVSLTDIVISEGAVNDFGNVTGASGTISFTISLTSPDFNFVNTGSASRIPGTSDITTPSIVVNATSVQIDFSFNNNPTGSFLDAILISGLQVKAVSGTASSTDLLLTAMSGSNAGSPEIIGLVTGTTVFGTVVSVDPPTAFAGADDKSCFGVPYSFLGAAATNSNGTILWTTNGLGSLSSANTLTPTYTPDPGETGNITFTLTVTGNGNCGTVEDTKVVQFLPKVVADAGVDKSICVGSSVPIGGSPTAVGGTGVYGYTWTNGATGVSNPVVSPATTTTYLLTVTDDFGCVDNTQDVIVNVSAIPPTPAITDGTGPGPDTQCQGAGTITLTSDDAPIGGSYQWYKNGSPISGAVNKTLSLSETPANTGNYTVKVIDVAPFCASVQSAPYILTINPLPSTAPVVSPSAVNVCNNATTTITVNGTQPGVNYQAFNLGTGLQVSGSVAGTGGSISLITGALTSSFSLIVKASFPSSGCTATLSSGTSVSVTPNPIANAGAPLNVCRGSTVSLNGSASSGSGGFSYSWSPSVGLSATNINNPVFSGLITTTYSLTVTDVNLCSSAVSTVTVTVNPNPVPVISGPVSVCENSTGVVYSSSGSGPTYNWTVVGGTISSPLGTNSITVDWGLAGPGTVQLQEQNGFSCSVTTPLYNVTKTTTPVAHAGSPQTVCSGVSVTLGGSPSATSGNGSYSYSWSGPGGFTSTQSNPIVTAAVGSNVYSLTVTDGNGCVSTVSTATITVNPLPVADAGTPLSVCSGLTTTLNGAASGGTGPYSYSWSPSVGLSATNINNPVFSGLITTTYSLTVTDVNLCSSAVSTVTVTVNPNPVPVISGPVSVCENSTGVVYSSSGSGPTYNWTVVGGTISSPLGTNSITVDWGLAGSGTVQLQEQNGFSCSVTTPLYNVTKTTTPVAHAGSPQTVCSGVSVTLGGSPSATSGNGSYSYSWSGPGGFTSTQSNPIVTAAVGSNVYSLTVTDGNGCVSTVSTATITVNPLPVADAGTPLSVCSGLTTTLNGAASGGTGPYSYSWSPSVGLSATNINNPVFSGLITTTYSLTVTDVNLCSSAVSTVTVTVNPNPVPVISGPVSVCENSTGVVYSSSGSGPTYNWTVVGGTISSPLGTNSITVDWGLAGPGTVQLQEQNGFSCSVTTPLYNVTKTTTPVAHAGSPQTVCSGVSVTLGGSPSATSGNGSYSYSWSGPGGFTSTQSNPIVTAAVGSNVYSLTVTDGNGCVSTVSTATITVNPLPVADAGTPLSVCSGLTTTLNGAASGGTGPYSYSWSPSVGLSATNINNPVFSGLITTTYSLTVTDVNLCSSAVSTVTVTVNPNPVPVISGPVSVCENSTGVVYSSSGSGPTYNWTVVGGTISSPLGTNSITVDWGLAGPGTVQLQEQNGFSCSVTTPLYNVTKTTTPVAHAGSPQTVCSGVSVTLGGSPSATSGNGSYSYSWSGPGGFTSTQSNPIVTAAVGSNVYSLTVTDGNGCVSTVSTATITVNPLPVADAGTPLSVCSGLTTTLNGAASGGTGPYSYSWSPSVGLSATNINNPVFSGLITTTYSLTVTDVNLCSSAVSTVTVTVNPNPVPVISGPVSVCENSTGVVYSSSGSGPTYNWTVVGGTISSPLGTNSITVDWGLAGPGTVQLQEQNGFSCSVTTPLYNVTKTTTPVAHAGSPQTVCSGVSVTLGGSPSATSGNGSYSYSWSGPGGFTSTQSNPIVTAAVGSNVYSLTVTDGNGCVSTVSTATITVNPLPVADAGTPLSVCSGLTTTLNGAASGGTGPYSYSWSPSVGLSATNINNPVFSGLITTTYSLTVTDVNLCSSAVSTVTVTVNPNPVPVISGPVSVCENSTGVVYSSSGSGPTYNWTVVGGTISSPLGTNSITVDWGLAGPGTVQLQEQNGFSCSVTTPLYNVTKTTTPVAHAGSPQTVCSGVSVTLGGSPSATSGNGSYSYSWSGPGGFTSTQSNPIVTAAVGSNVYSLTVTDGNGCVSTVSTATITVNPLPVADAGTPLSVCSGLTTTLNGAASGGTGPYSYSWSPSVGLSATNINNPVFSGLITTTYSLTVTDANLCSSAVSTVTVTVNPLPIAAAGSNQIICEGTSVGLGGSPTATSGTAPYSYSWSSTPLGYSSLLPNPSVIPIVGTTVYTVVITDNNGCISASSSKSVTVNPSPVGSLTTVGAVCSNTGFTVNPQNYISNSVSSSFVWTRALAPGLNPIVSGAGSGNITETLENKTGGTLNATYTITPTSIGGSCVGVNYDIIVPIQSEPVGTSLTGGSSLLICSGFSPLYNLQGGISPAQASTFIWKATADNLNVSGESLVYQSNGTLSDVLVNTSGVQQSVTYTITPTGSNGCVGSSYSVQVKIDSSPLGVSDIKSAVCSGTGFSYDAQLNVDAGNLVVSTFTWSRFLPVGLVQLVGSGGSGSGLIAETLQNLTGGSLSAVYTVTPQSSAGCFGSNFTVTVPVSPGPVVSSGQVKTICSGSNVDYKVVLTPGGAPTGTTYSWPAPSVSSGPSIGSLGSTAESSVLTITEPLVNTTGGVVMVTYTITPTSATGCVGAPVDVVITVNPEPVILPGQTQLICSGSNVNYKVTLSPGGLPAGTTYSWPAPSLSAGGPQGSAGVNVPESNLNTITEVLTNTTGGVITATYKITPKSALGCLGAQTDVVVTINPAPVITSGQTQLICSGSNVNYKVTLSPGGSPVGTTYTWPVPVMSAGPGQGSASVGSIPESNAFTITEPLINVTGSPITATYTITPKNGTCFGTPVNVVVTINPAPVGSLTTVSGVCSNLSFTITPQTYISNSVSSSFVWTRSLAPGLNAIVSGAGVGNITETLENKTGGTLNATYTITPTSIGGSCVGVNYDIIVPIQSEPVGTSLTGGSSLLICSGFSPLYNLQGGISPAQASTFIWKATADNLNVSGESLVYQSNGTLSDVLVNTSGVQQSVTYTITPTGSNGCVGSSYSVQVKIDSSPLGVSDVKSAVCSGTGFSYDAQLNVDAGNLVVSTFTWSRFLPVGLVQLVGSGGSGSGLIAETLQNLTGGSLSAVYTVTPQSSAGCFGSNFTVTVPVSPGPVVTAGQVKTICSGSNVDYKVVLTPGGAPTGTTYSWPAPSVSSGPSIGSLGSTAESSVLTITEPLVNTTGGVVMVTYTITPTSATGCVGAPVDVVITVNPEPVILPGQTQLICSGSNVNYKVTLSPGGLPAGTTYSWPAPSLSAGGPQGSAGVNVPESNLNTITEVLTNTTGGVITATYKITPKSALGCLGAQTDVVVTINPAPVITSGQTQLICSGSNVNYKVTLSPGGSPVGTTYTWPVPVMSAGPGQGSASVGSIPESNAFTITEPLINVTGSPITATYTITPKNGTCFGTPVNVVVTINPAPVGSLTTVSGVCSNLSFTITPQTYISNSVSSSFVWTRSLAPGLNAIVSGAGVGNITETLENKTGGTLNATYTITPTSIGGSCVGVNYDIIVPIQSEPVGTSLTGGSSLLICSGFSPLYNLQGGISPAQASTFIWKATADNLNVSGESLVYQSNGTLSDVLVNTSGVQQSVTYTITPTGSNGCVGSSYSVQVKIDSSPLGVSDVKSAVCSGTGFSYDAQLNVDAGNLVVSTFTWSRFLPVGLVQLVGSGGSGSGLIAETLQNLTGGSLSAVYTVTPQSSAGCFGSNFTVTVPVSPGPVVTAGQVKTICSGSNVDYKVVLTPGGAPTGTTYSWPAPSVSSGPSIGSLGSTAESSVLTITEPLVNTTGGVVMVTYTITPTSATGCVGAPVDVVITVNPEPVILPGQTQLICSGSNVNYKVTLSPGGLPAGTTYSWPAPSLSAGGPQGSAGVNVPESNLNTITEVLTNTTGGVITATYKITPKSALGCLGAQTDVVVTINPAPVITSGQTQLICSGSNVNYKVTLSPVGSPVGTTYTWPVPVMSAGPGQGSASVGSIPESNAFTITEPLINVTGFPITATYTITPKNGTCFGAPVNVVVTINPVPVIPPGQIKTICSGQNVNFKVLLTPGGAPAGTTYSWPAPTLSGGPVQGSLGSAAESNPLTIIESLSNITGGPITATYKVTPTSASGCVGTQVDVVITVNPEPVILGGQTQLICSGSNVNYKVVLTPGGAPAGTTYSWPAPIMSTGGPQGAPGIAVPEANIFTLTDILTNTTGAPITATYKITPLSSLGCTGGLVNVVVTINPAPVVMAGQTQVICSGQNVNYKVTLTPGGAPAGTTYDWPVPTISGGPPQGSAGSSIPESNTFTIIEPLTNVTGSPITVTYTITPKNGTCFGAPVNVVVTVNPAPVISTSQMKTICSNTHADYRVTLTPGGFPAGTKYTWLLPTMSAGGAQGNAGTLVPESNVLTIQDLLLNTTGSSITATYKITPTSASGCTGLQTDVVITINPEPVGANSTKTICSADPLKVNYDLQANVDATHVLPSNFSWIALSNGNVTGESLLTHTGSIIDDELVNTTNAPEIVTYNIIPTATSTGCTGNQFSISVTVNPKANISAGPDLALCEDTPGIALQGSVNYAPNGVSWSGGAGGFSAPTSPTSNYSFTAPEVNTSILLTLTANDPDGAGPCVLVTSQMHLKVNKLPIVVYSGLPPVMAENQTPVTLTGNQAGGLFSILPITSNIGSTVASPVDKASFDPSAVTLGSNSVTYTFIDGNGCKNMDVHSVIVNPVSVIDFGLQYLSGAIAGNFVPPNGVGTFEVCGNVGSLKIVGNPLTTTGQAPTFFAPAGPTASILALYFSQVGPDFFIDTNGLPSGDYAVTYTYTNSLGATSTPFTRAIRVFAGPTAVITPPTNNCIVSAIILVDNSTMPPPAQNPFGGVITGWTWNFGDGNLGTGPTTSHVYSTPSVYAVSLDVVTNQGCHSIANLPLRVGPQPQVNFDWSAICTNDLTKFADLSNPGISTIITYNWDFGDGNLISGPPTSPAPDGGTNMNPFHNYVNTGTYPAKLTVNTNDGCTNSLTRNVFILTGGLTVQPTVGTPYKADFESTNSWIPEGLLLPPPATPGTTSPISWILGTPNGSNINSAASGSKSWWTGANVHVGPGFTYYDLEASAINGPCFDLTLLKRPMVALDYWTDAEKNLDGTVVQYSTDGGLHWAIVGPLPGLTGSQRDQGMNWYDPNATIVSNPGGQLIGQYGWTDKSGGWKNGRFNLDMVDPTARGQVRIRLAFSSNNKNAAGSTFDGFAFDNVYVGEKQRNVLVEHFTNSSLAASVTGDAWVNQRYQDQLTNRGTSDFYDVQYHISIPNNDPLNADNPSDAAGRSLFLGVSQPPFTVMDGLDDGIKYKGNYTDLDVNGVEVDRRALNDPKFDLKLTATASGNLISVNMDITAKLNYNSSLIAQVVLLENNVGTFKNVMRKQLFGPDGETITLPFNGPPSPTTVTKTKSNVAVNVPITNPGNLTLIGYVQDKNTKEIYQSIVIPSPAVQGAVITAIEPDPIAPTTLNGISIYPNPARGTFNFRIPEGQSSEGFSWKVIDQRGVTVRSGDFDDMLNHVKPVSVADLANGVYIVTLAGPGGSVVYRKMVIMN